MNYPLKVLNHTIPVLDLITALLPDWEQNHAIWLKIWLTTFNQKSGTLLPIRNVILNCPVQIYVYLSTFFWPCTVCFPQCPVCLYLFFSRAFVYLSQNNYAEAHASFTEVLKMDPKNPVVSFTTPTVVNTPLTLQTLYSTGQGPVA